VETWGTDEHRVGLKPILRWVWAPAGQRPLAPVWHRYEWVYLVGFIHPPSGRVAWYLVPRISLEIFAAVLALFAQEQQVGRGKIILLTLDGAGWHASANLKVPEGIVLEFQPPYSPEVQPAEHLWPLCDEALANEAFKTIDDLEDCLGRRCCVLADQPEVLSSTTRFHWWPNS
jgi:transposase